MSHPGSMPLRLLTILTLALALGATIAVARQGDGARSAKVAKASATAFARSGTSGERGRVSVSGNGSRSAAGTTVTASTDGGRASAGATAVVRRVNIFSGLVTAGAVEVTASASSGATSTSGSVSSLGIAGEPVASPAEAARYDLDGYGTLSALTSDGGAIIGLRATLTKPYKGHPAGATVAIAYASASATDGADPAAAKPRSRRRATTPGGSEDRDAAPPARKRRGRPAPRPAGERPPSASEREEGPRAPGLARRRRAPRLDTLPTGRGYAFPVYGTKTAYGNDWGAPRQHTGTHEGNDIFAPNGTPVLAVTDGVLYRVGTRAIPGNRLWLRNRRGDTFFYGHLSAFAHDARNGARVRAGDVIGFVGTTGDAERTPPHLHFEIHPRDGEAVNPYPFLRAWEERRDVPAAAWLTRYGNDPGSRPGALVVLRDFLDR